MSICLYINTYIFKFPLSAEAVWHHYFQWLYATNLAAPNPAPSNSQHSSHQSRSVAQGNIFVECHNSVRRVEPAVESSLIDY